MDKISSQKRQRGIKKTHDENVPLTFKKILSCMQLEGENQSQCMSNRILIFISLPQYTPNLLIIFVGQPRVCAMDK